MAPGAVEKEAGSLSVDEEWEVPEVDEGKMPAMTVLVVSDGAVADVCKVPAPPEEPSIDEDVAAGSVVVDAVPPADATSELAAPLEPVDSDCVPPVPSV